MDDKLTKRQRAKQRASFARADRIRKERGDKSAKPDKTKGSTKRDAARPAPANRPRSAKAKKARPERELVLYQRYPSRADRQRDRAEAAKRKDAAKSTEQRKEAQKRTAEQKQRETKKVRARRQETQRKDANRKEADRRAAAQKEAQRQRTEQQRALAQRARADIEAGHKRQRDEQQQQHRRETDMMRTRHKGERDSFRSQERDATMRHAGAINRLDAREQRELNDLAVRQNSLQGRLAALRPGSAKAREQARQNIRDRHDAERMKTHRNHEAYKERSFAREQATRIQHAKERFVAFGAHREQRQELQNRQEAQRPQLVEQRQRAIVAAHEQEKTRGPARPPEPPRPEAAKTPREPFKPRDLTETFNRAR